MDSRRLSLILALVCLLAIPFAIRDDLIGMVGHTVVAQWCHGVSAGKVWFFLVYLAVALAIVATLPNRRVRSGANGSDGIAPADDFAGIGRIGGMVIVAWLVGHAAALWSFLVYQSVVQPPSGWPSFHWREGVPSVNSLFHIHTSKAALGRSLEMVGLESLAMRFDTGWSYVKLVPWSASVLGAMSFAVALVASLWTIIRVARRWSGAERVAGTLALAVSGSALTKGILDGGPLAYDTVISAWWWVALCGAKAPQDVVIRPGFRERVGAAALLGWVLLAVAFRGTGVGFVLEAAIYRFGLMALIVVMPCMWSGMRSGSITPTLARQVGLVVLVVGISAYRAIEPVWQPLLQPAPRAAVAVDDSGRMRSVPLNAGMSRFEAYRSLDERPNRARRHALPPVDSSATTLFAWIKIVDGPVEVVIRDDVDHAADVLRLEPIHESESGARAYYLEAAFPANGPSVWPSGGRADGQWSENERYVAYFALDHRLRALGIREYVLVPLTFARSDATTVPTKPEPSGRHSLQ